MLFAAMPLTAQTQQAASRHDLDMTVVQPESVGFSSARLERLHAMMQQTVDNKQVAGIVTLLARHGKVVDYRAYGVRDLATGAPMTKDSIFRDYSMTKPVTGAAMMILYEQGKWQPSDPIAKFIPEFAHLKVFKGMDADGKTILVDPDHAPTMQELMTHTAGFTYGFFGNTPVDKMYRDAKVSQAQNLQEMIDKLAKIPLLYQPGTQWVYSMSMDIEGYIVEKLSGETLPDFMRDQIFAPLGMKDAGFYVPAGKRDRFASVYETGSQGKLIPIRPGQGSRGLYGSAHHALRRRRPGFHDGGLLPFCADAGKRRRTERGAHSGPGHRAPDDLKSFGAQLVDRPVRHWPVDHAPRLRLRL